MALPAKRRLPAFPWRLRVRPATKVRGWSNCHCAIAILALSVRSTIRSSDWSNEEKFYKRTLAAGGTSCRVGVNLGQIYANRGEYAIAEKMFRHVLETNPDYLIARNNLAMFWCMREKLPKRKPACAGRPARQGSESSVSSHLDRCFKSRAYALGSERRYRSHCGARARARRLSRSMGTDQS